MAKRLATRRLEAIAKAVSNPLLHWRQLLGLTLLLVSCETSSVPSEPVELISAVGIDYRFLESRLQQHQWQAADHETFQLMLRVANRQAEGWLSQADVETFPCEDLNTLASLWYAYSDGRFGFLRQQQLWESVGGISGQYVPETAEALGERVGWRQQETWLTYDQLIFNRRAPEGHLPASTGNGVSGGVWGGVGAIAGRLKYCPLID
ncbi:MAG: GUN4 domain-containing protein, partial [Leptolyngbya sp. SIO1D8]|nr:GUN4 domain-containing protein [Leptolyngbya sp. SIO1D8]